MEAINEMRAECVRHYVERRHTPNHADVIVPKNESEILRLCKHIQEETEKAKRCRQIPRPIVGLNIVEIAEANKEINAG